MVEEKIDHAITFFEYAIQYCNTFAASMFHLGLMFRRKARFTEALQQFTKVQELMPNDLSNYIQRGLVYQDMGNHQYAIKDFNKAIEIDADYHAAHFHLGVSKLKSREVRESIDNFARANELKEEPAVYDGLGCCWHYLEDFEQAIENFNTAIAAESDNVDFLRNRAQCYFDM